MKNKAGRLKHKQVCTHKFRTALKFCELEDLCFVGDPYTWRNNSHKAESYVKERLDRVVASLEWRMHFPTYKVKGDPRNLDHRLVILSLEPEFKCERRPEDPMQPKFEARWVEEEQCEDVVQNACELAMVARNSTVAEAIKRVGCELHA